MNYHSQISLWEIKYLGTFINWFGLIKAENKKMNILEKALSTKLITAAIFDPDLRVCFQISIEFYEFEFLAQLQ